MALAQSVPEAAPVTPPLKKVSTAEARPPADQQADATTTELSKNSESESFQIPVEQHPWARFQPGAWRELQITSETFGVTGETISRSVTRQKEVLQAVAEGKYVLNVQAIVDLSGTRIVGDWKTRVLQLATDGAGPLVDSRRLEDQTFQLMGRATECQVWEIRYREGARNLADRIFYDAQQFPFVLQRETFTTDGPNDNIPKGAARQAEQRVEVTVPSVPYLLGEQLLECSCLRTFRHRAKGDTLRLTFSSSVVPGGEVAVWSTDLDAQGLRVQTSMAELLAYGETSPNETRTDETPADEKLGDETRADETLDDETRLEATGNP